jgi:hypothetical protein
VLSIETDEKRDLKSHDVMVGQPLAHVLDVALTLALEIPIPRSGYPSTPPGDRKFESLRAPALLKGPLDVWDLPQSKG